MTSSTMKKRRQNENEKIDEHDTKWWDLCESHKHQNENTEDEDFSKPHNMQISRNHLAFVAWMTFWPLKQIYESFYHL